MKVGTYTINGTPLNYDESRGSFDVDGMPVTADRVRELDNLGKIVWDGENRAWFLGAFPGSVPAASAPAAQSIQPKNTTNVWVTILAVGVLLFSCGTAAGWISDAMRSSTPAGDEPPVSAPVQESVAQPTQAEPAEQPGNYGPGVYLVGTDMPAGRYKGTPDSGEMAYWAVKNDANGVDIVANGNETGQFYLEATNGQYVEISRATITKAP